MPSSPPPSQFGRVRLFVCSDTRSRINEAFDRGYASLDILYTVPEDTGMYSCVVRNLVDSATANAVQISVIPEEAEQYTTVSMQNEAYDEMSRREREMEQEAHSVAPPSFARDISCAQPNVAEGQAVRLMGEITPYDGSLRVDWLKDGQPIVIESYTRF
nr:unnamed protein product [Spirometra erinaceieuropaei]